MRPGRVPLQLRDAERVALGLVVLALATGITGCTRASMPVAASSSMVEASPTLSAEAASPVTAVQVRELLANFNMPEEPGDPGYRLLGLYHNDEAAWTRTVVLAHTDYGSLVRSLESQLNPVPRAALGAFDRRLASTGATGTFDWVVNAQWRIEDGKPAKDDELLVTLVPASTFMATLFDREGRLGGSYSRESITASGTLATAVYIKPGSPDVSLKLELARAPDGRLVLIGVRDFAEFKDALGNAELVDGLP
jgi:hypothetical protein